MKHNKVHVFCMLYLNLKSRLFFFKGSKLYRYIKDMYHFKLLANVMQLSGGISSLSNDVVVQLLSCVRLFATPLTVAYQASLSFTVSQSLLKFMSIELVMPSNHIVFYLPLLLPSIFPSFRVFSSESVLHIRWPVLELQLQHQSFQ